MLRPSFGLWIVRSVRVGLHLYAFRMRRRSLTTGIGDIQHADCTRVNAHMQPRKSGLLWDLLMERYRFDIRFAHGLELS